MKTSAEKVAMLLAAARAKSRVALPAAQELLNDLDPEVVAAAVMALAVLDPGNLPWDVAETLAGHPGELAQVALRHLATADGERAREAIRARLGARTPEARRAAMGHAADQDARGLTPAVLRALFTEAEPEAAARIGAWLARAPGPATLEALAGMGIFQVPPASEGQKVMVRLANELLAAAHPDPGDRTRRLAELKKAYAEAGTQDAMNQSGLKPRSQVLARPVPRPAKDRSGLGWAAAAAAFAGLAWWVTRPPAGPPIELVAAPVAEAGPKLSNLGEPGARVSFDALPMRQFGPRTLALRHEGGRGVMAEFAEGVPGWIKPGSPIHLVGTLRGYLKDPGNPALVDATGADKR